MNTEERKETISLGESATNYIGAVNPEEVSQQVILLQHLKGELEKPHLNPASAFMAGSLDAGMDLWLLNHCPSELVWGIPTTPYATALGACKTLEPELRRFERNIMGLIP